MSVIKVDTIQNRDGSGGPILSGLTTVGVLTSGLSIGSTNAYFEYAGIGIVTSVTSIGVTNVWASGTLSGTLSGDGSSITAINASNISSGTLANARLSSTVNVTNLESGQLNVSGVSTFGNTVNINSNVNIADSDVLNIGSGGDLQLFHNGSNSFIDQQGTGDLYFRSQGDLYFQTLAGGTKVGLAIIDDADVKLYYNNSEKLATTSGGVNITGVATATSFVGDLTGDVTGNADTATSATSATTATNATNITLADESSDTTCFPVFATSATGNQAPKTDSDRLTYNASSGLLVASTHQSTSMIADSTMRVGSATTSNSLYVVGNSASNVVGLTSQTSSFALDFSLGNNFSFVIGGNITLNNPTGVTTGQSGIIEITQDDTGSRTMAFQSHWNFADGTAPTITAGAGTTSVLAYFVKDTDMIITTSILALG